MQVAKNQFQPACSKAFFLRKFCLNACGLLLPPPHFFYDILTYLYIWKASTYLPID